MNTIPLHQLPDEAFKRVLRNMEINEQLAYSLCSKNTKEAIKSLNLKAEAIHICVNQKIIFDFFLKDSVDFRSSIAHDNHSPNEEFKLSNCVEVSVRRNSTKTATKWKMESRNFRVKDWLRHLCEVFHNHRIDELYFGEDQIDYDFIKPVQRIIEGLHIVSLSLGERITPEFTKKALESFHNYETLYIEQVPFNSYEVHKMDKFLVQNLRSVFIPRTGRLQIDQVLSSNCEKLRLSGSLFTDKDLKVFLELWIRGSNPRLKHFSTWKENQSGERLFFDEEVVFKGINRTKIPLDCQEEYREKIGKYAWNIMGLAGGSRIWSYDGSTAVVLIRRFKFEFIVGI
ncbi:unnamed protein product [Caenorhabditis brenneri]